MAKQQPHQCFDQGMLFYHKFKPGKDEALSPEEKAKALSKLRRNCKCISPGVLFQQAAMYDVLPQLVEKEEGMDDDKFIYIINSLRLLAELDRHLVEDDGPSFTQFLHTNPDFVLRFPLSNLYELLCWDIPAPTCLTALLESSALRRHVNVDFFGPGHAYTPLEAAARHLSPRLTRILLQFGADVRVKGSRGTPLTAALETFRSNKLIMDWTCNPKIFDLFILLSKPELKGAVTTIYDLAYASRTDVDTMVTPIICHYDGVLFALLLVIAFPILFCHNGAAFKFPVVCSSLPCDDIWRYAYKQRKLKEAENIVTSVWYVGRRSCRLQLVCPLLSSAAVKGLFPSILHHYCQHYSAAHSFEMPEGSEEGCSVI